MHNTDGRLILTAEVTKNKMFKYILLVLAILFFVPSAVRISMPSVFCILDILLIQAFQGRVVRKPISANPGLKINREFNFFCIKVFLLFMFCED